MALGTVAGQFKMPGSLLQENFVDKTCTDKAFEGAINRDLVRPSRGKVRSNLVRCLRFADAEQNA